ncbi:unnamed protein product [Schistosoma margrebowiei]|uniref:Uncharacterized protein n=1 Tax=Schistosoma margrebowiei TaxID=48269 RepID=A0A3P8GSH1_9TREM|nr:unnamed protein product [Schistosoma margrebowiei]
MDSSAGYINISELMCALGLENSTVHFKRHGKQWNPGRAFRSIWD